MDNTKEMSKIAFNQQALTYDKDIKGQHARTLYPYILNMLKGRHFSSILDLGCGTGELLYQIQQIYHSKDLTGIDISDKMIATVYKGNIIKNLIMDCQSYTKYRPNETTGGIFVSWRRKEELPTGA